MNIKIKILVGILVMGIVLVGGWWIGSGRVYSETQNEVTIATDKTEYLQGETVKITIKNNTDNTKRVYYPYYAIGRFDKGNWMEIKKVVCPCEVDCKVAAYFILPPHKTMDFEWKQREERCSDPTKISKTISNQVPSGKYRVESDVGDESECRSCRPNIHTIYSEEFIIKQKLNTNINTDKIEYKQGEPLAFTIDGKVMVTKQGGEELPPYSIKDSAGNKLQLRHSCVGELGMGYDEYCENGKIKTVEVVHCSDVFESSEQEIHKTYTWDQKAYFRIEEECEGKTIHRELLKQVPAGKYKIIVYDINGNERVIKEFIIK